MTRILIRGPKSPFVTMTPQQMMGSRLMGGNSGNLIFLDSAWKLLSTRDAEITPDGFAPAEIGADAINERFDVYVIPMANAFRDTFQKQLDRYAAVIERLTIPVVLLSAGYQGKLPYNPGPHPMDDTVKRFVRAVMERSGSIAVRGEYTQAYVRNLGFNDVEVIGCPSMFLYGDQLEIVRRREVLDREARIGFNMTARVGPMGPIIESHMARYPKLEYIAQDKDSLRLMLWGTGSKWLPDPNPLPVHRSHPLLRDDRTRFYVDPWPWLDAMREMDFVFGTRIHGNIVSLLAGTPAFVFAHDTRTLELSRYFGIPYRVMDDIHPDTDAAELYAEADYGPLVDGHAARFRTYIDYVESHGLKHVFQPGEDPTAFDRRIASIDFPGPVHVRGNLRLHKATRGVRRAIRRIKGG